MEQSSASTPLSPCGYIGLDDSIGSTTHRAHVGQQRCGRRLLSAACVEGGLDRPLHVVHVEGGVGIHVFLPSHRALPGLADARLRNYSQRRAKLGHDRLAPRVGALEGRKLLQGVLVNVGGREGEARGGGRAGERGL